MRMKILNDIRAEDVILSGDGQCDSPGHTAKYLCYYLMDHAKNLVIHVEIVDKRQTQGNSSIMERFALDKSLVSLHDTINIVEVVTDASSTIKKMIGMTFQISTCSFMTQWIGLLHHVCNNHEWVEGKCDHDEINPETHKLPWFDRRDKDFEALQKIVCDPILLGSFKYYVKFRNDAFAARKQLAAIDYNYHIDRKLSRDKEGKLITSRKYNKRTKVWDEINVKEDKDYGYFPILLAKIYRNRVEKGIGMLATVQRKECDPRLIAPTIAAIPPPPTGEINRKSRFRT
ncbi:hypothetical protein QZH41_010922 [Actinostola sp. cb2023]|nr:hypothetical protein QZH41_010922 [Actinostola sp. cb2023]